MSDQTDATIQHLRERLLAAETAVVAWSDAQGKFSRSRSDVDRALIEIPSRALHALATDIRARSG